MIPFHKISCFLHSLLLTLLYKRCHYHYVDVCISEKVLRKFVRNCISYTVSGPHFRRRNTSLCIVMLVLATNNTTCKLDNYLVSQAILIRVPWNSSADYMIRFLMPKKALLLYRNPLRPHKLYCINCCHYNFRT